MSNTDILVGVICYKRARVTTNHGYSSRDVSLKLTTTRNKILTNVLFDTKTNNIGQLEIVHCFSILLTCTSPLPLIKNFHLSLN